MKTRIGIIGLGGVGGYFGGLLAETYFNSSTVEIIFITKPETEKIIKRKGLKIVCPEGERIVFPDLVTSSSNEIGVLDVLIVAVKSYDLIESVAHIRNAINNETILLPLLNGIDAKSVLEKMFPVNLVLDGCVFIISKLLERGVIKKYEGKAVLFFGATTADKRLVELEQIFANTAINAHYVPNILEIVWGKYLFISSLASVTSYLDKTVGQLFENEAYKKLLVNLMTEFKAVADAQFIPLSTTIVKDTLQKMEALPYETTTSMQRDFQQNRKTEYLSLTSYIASLGNELGLNVPTYQFILTELEKKVNKVNQ